MPNNLLSEATVSSGLVRHLEGTGLASSELYMTLELADAFPLLAFDT